MVSFATYRCLIEWQRASESRPANGDFRNVLAAENDFADW